MSGSQPPGWYPAPGSPAVERWWDGTKWTGEVREANRPGSEQSVTARFADGATAPSLLPAAPPTGPSTMSGPVAGPGATGAAAIPTGGWSVAWPGTGPMISRAGKGGKKAKDAGQEPAPVPEAAWRIPAIEAWAARTDPDSDRKSRRRRKKTD